MDEEDRPLLFGQAMTRFRVIELATELRTRGLRVEVRQSAHMTGGEYIRVYDGDHFQFERISGTEYLVSADDDSMESLLATASFVSRELTHLRIRHRFELCLHTNDLVHYLHYDWPLEPAEQDAAPDRSGE